MKETKRISIEHADGEEGKFHGASVHVDHGPHRREGRHGIVETFQEPEHKTFGENEGYEMLGHIATHLNIPEPGEGETEEEDAKEEKEEK